jgi:hypothetical protein
VAEFLASSRALYLLLYARRRAGPGGQPCRCDQIKSQDARQNIRRLVLQDHQIQRRHMNRGGAKYSDITDHERTVPAENVVCFYKPKRGPGPNVSLFSVVS